LTLIVTALAIGLTAVLACVPPALRAMRIDPLSALKAQ
jgi:ABC-type lipoprotein release transport system permease subunit